MTGGRAQAWSLAIFGSGSYGSDAGGADVELASNLLTLVWLGSMASERRNQRAGLPKRLGDRMPVPPDRCGPVSTSGCASGPRRRPIPPPRSAIAGGCGIAEDKPENRGRSGPGDGLHLPSTAWASLARPVRRGPRTSRYGPNRRGQGPAGEKSERTIGMPSIEIQGRLIEVEARRGERGTEEIAVTKEQACRSSPSGKARDPAPVGVTQSAVAAGGTLPHQRKTAPAVSCPQH